MTEVNIKGSKENYKLVVNADGSINTNSIAHTSTDLEGKGEITVGTSPIQLSFSGKTESISIQSDPESNTGYIYVGKSDVLSNGSNSIQKLDLGETLIIDFDDDTNSIYVVATVASQKVIAGALK